MSHPLEIGSKSVVISANVTTAQRELLLQHAKKIDRPLSYLIRVAISNYTESLNNGKATISPQIIDKQGNQSSNV